MAGAIARPSPLLRFASAESPRVVVWSSKFWLRLDRGAIGRLVGLRRLDVAHFARKRVRYWPMHASLL
eukprot:2417444-Alexandrium_andersonii.AAC.1